MTGWVECQGQVQESESYWPSRDGQSSREWKYTVISTRRKMYYDSCFEVISPILHVVSLGTYTNDTRSGNWWYIFGSRGWSLMDAINQLPSDIAASTNFLLHSSKSLCFQAFKQWSLPVYNEIQPRCLPYSCRAYLWNAPLSIILWILAAFSGLVVFANYADCDPLKAGIITKQDQIIPYYVMDKLGHIYGLPGLFLACLFSGALRSASLWDYSCTEFFTFLILCIWFIFGRAALYHPVWTPLRRWPMLTVSCSLHWEEKSPNSRQSSSPNSLVSFQWVFVLGNSKERKRSFS